MGQDTKRYVCKTRNTKDGQQSIKKGENVDQGFYPSLLSCCYEKNAMIKSGLGEERVNFNVHI